MAKDTPPDTALALSFLDNLCSLAARLARTEDTSRRLTALRPAGNGQMNLDPCRSASALALTLYQPFP
jgi:hypothetical protein